MAPVVLMAGVGGLLVVGLALTLAWGGVAYAPGDPGPAPAAVARRYLRSLAVAVTGGFWTGVLVTGPAVRLIMRLLAVTAGDAAQGRITEADEVVGAINVGGTVALIVFGGILPGLASGALWVIVHRWLPAGRLGGVAFGGLHLVVAATRIDPLRPGNGDFDLVGPGWLSALTFGLAAVVHGMAVAALVNRYSRAFPPAERTRAAWAWAIAPLVPAALIVALAPALVLVLALGLAAVVGLTRLGPVVRAARSRAALVAGRVALAALALVLLPGAVADLRDVIVRDGVVAVR
jgi:hypothetical protein